MNLVNQNRPKTTRDVLAEPSRINYRNMIQSASLVLECDVYIIFNGMYFHRKKMGVFGIKCNFNGLINMIDTELQSILNKKKFRSVIFIHVG